MRVRPIPVFLDPDDQIRCEYEKGYPVLTLEGSLTSLAIYPGWEGLKRLRDVICACLAVHAPDNLTDELMTAAEELMQGLAEPVPAEACTGAIDAVTIEWPGGKQEYRAVPGTAVDLDELFESMAAGDGVRRDIP